MSTDALHHTHDDTTRSRPVSSTGERAPVGAFSADQDTLRRISWLIELGIWIVNGLIGLRFVLKLMAANPDNPFSQLIYFLTAPFLAIFVGLTQTPSFDGYVIEFYDLIAMVVYFVLGWALIRLLWILFARIRPS